MLANSVAEADKSSPPGSVKHICTLHYYTVQCCYPFTHTTYTYSEIYYNMNSILILYCTVLYTVQYIAELLSVTRLWRCGDGSGNQTRDQLIQLVKTKAQGIEPKHGWFWQSDQGPAHPAGQDQSTRSEPNHERKVRMERLRQPRAYVAK